MHVMSFCVAWVEAVRNQWSTVVVASGVTNKDQRMSEKKREKSADVRVCARVHSALGCDCC